MERVGVCTGTEPSVYLGKWIQMMMENNAVRALMELAKRKHTEELSKFMGMGKEGLFSRILVLEPWQEENVDSKVSVGWTKGIPNPVKVCLANHSSVSIYSFYRHCSGCGS